MEKKTETNGDGEKRLCNANKLKKKTLLKHKKM